MACAIIFPLVPEQQDQDDDRDGHAQKPKQDAATHGTFLSAEVCWITTLAVEFGSCRRVVHVVRTAGRMAGRHTPGEVGFALTAPGPRHTRDGGAPTKRKNEERA
jgi:hypothetical protein